MNDRLAPPPRVIHFIGSLDTGGAERSVVNYLLHADRQAYRHAVVCFDGRGHLAPSIEAVGVPVQFMRIRHRHLLVSLLRVVKYLRQEQASVIHAHMYWAALWGRLAGRLAGVPVMIVTEHGPELWKTRRHVLIERFLERWTNRHIAVARDGREIRIRREGIREDRIDLIPNGVAIPDLSVGSDSIDELKRGLGLNPVAPIIGTVGRIVVEKGYTHLLDALLIARRSYPDLTWLAVGDGPLRAELADKARELGLQDAIVWAGLRGDVESLLAVMDLWVMSSVEEGLPVALLEAMAAARPIVATRVGGIPDAVHDGNEALLVPPADPQALAAAMLDLLRDPLRARALGNAARSKAVSDYSITSVARRIEAVYRDELARL